MCLWRVPANVEAFISVHWFQFAVPSFCRLPLAHVLRALFKVLLRGAWSSWGGQSFISGHNPELHVSNVHMWVRAKWMGKHFGAVGFSWIKYLLISCSSLCPWRIQLKLNNKGGQACDLKKNTYPVIIGILGLTINARTVELGASPKKSNRNDEGAER